MTNNKPTITAYHLQAEPLPDGREIIRIRNAADDQIIAMSITGPGIPLEKVQQRLNNKIRRRGEPPTAAKMAYLFVSVVESLTPGHVRARDIADDIEHIAKGETDQ